jgi:hypothetical protein
MMAAVRQSRSFCFTANTFMQSWRPITLLAVFSAKCKPEKWGIILHGALLMLVSLSPIAMRCRSVNDYLVTAWPNELLIPNESMQTSLLDGKVRRAEPPPGYNLHQRVNHELLMTVPQ